MACGLEQLLARSRLVMLEDARRALCALDRIDPFDQALESRVEQALEALAHVIGELLRLRFGSTFEHAT